MPIDLFTDRISRTVTGLAFCLAILPATSNAFTQDDQRRRCLSALRVGNSECRAYYGLHAQATVQSKRGLSPRFRQTNRAIGLGEVIRAREGGLVSASRECAPDDKLRLIRRSRAIEGRVTPIGPCLACHQARIRATRWRGPVGKARPARL